MTPRTIAGQAPLSLGFPRQEYLRGCRIPSSGHLPGPGIELASTALADKFFTTEPPGKQLFNLIAVTQEDSVNSGKPKYKVSKSE